MAFFDNFNNPLYAPIEKGIGGLSNLTEGMNIFAAKPSEALTGILTTDQQEKLKNQALFQGLLGAGMTYLAQPKNQGYGSALPYLGKAYLGGMQSSQGVYDQAAKDYMMAQQIKELKDKQAQKAAYQEIAPKLFTTTPAVTKDVVQAGGYVPSQTEVSADQTAPNFNLVKQPDVVTKQVITPEQTQFNQ